MPRDTDSAKSTDQLHLDRFIPYRLSVLTNIISMSIARAYEREFGLSIPEWRVMAVLARYPDLSAVEVAERTAMDKVAVSRAVSRLLSRRRLTRVYDKVDKRRSILRLSAAGESVYMRVAPLALKYEQELLDALSASDRRALERLLSRLLERARALSSTPSFPRKRESIRRAACAPQKKTARSRGTGVADARREPPAAQGCANGAGAGMRRSGRVREGDELE